MSETKQKFNIVSLGCARNLVDSEVMAGILRQKQISKWCESRTMPTWFWSIPAALSAPLKKNPSTP